MRTGPHRQIGIGETGNFERSFREIPDQLQLNPTKSGLKIKKTILGLDSECPSPSGKLSA
jgi:hypothetical protein